MRTFLARCTMLGLLGGGFALTGDAGWILNRGRSLLDATTVPRVADAWGAATAPAVAEPPSQGAGAASPPPAMPVPAAPPVAPPAWAADFRPTPAEVQVTPSLATSGERPPADGGKAVIDLRLLSPGDRVRVWSGDSCVAFDVIDPAAGDAIQQPATRRVRIGGAADPLRLERGGMVVVQPRAGIGGHEPPAERIGPVQALGL